MVASCILHDESFIIASKRKKKGIELHLRSNIDGLFVGYSPFFNQMGIGVCRSGVLVRKKGAIGIAKPLLGFPVSSNRK
jgi:hypothetical protein